MHPDDLPPDRTRSSDRLFATAEAAHQAADGMRTHASGPLFVAQLAPGGKPQGWLVLTAEEAAAHPSRQDFTSVREVAPPLADATTIEVTAVLPGTHNVVSLGTMEPAGAMALLDMMRDADGLVVEPGDEAARSRGRLPAPTGYVVHVDPARPGQLTVRLTFVPRSMADVQNGYEDLNMPGGDTHSGPASLVVLLDHWAEEHGYRFVHTADQLNQPIEQFLADLAPADRQRVVIAVEEDDDGGLVRIGEALAESGDVVEVAALSMDWIASLPGGR